MPPKNKNISKHSNRSDVQEKVKEIKQRQQNWLRQRDDALKSHSVNTDIQETEAPPRHPPNVATTAPGGNKAVTIAPTSTHATGRGKGFKAWMKAKEDTSANKRELGKSYVVSDHGDSASSRSIEKPLSPEQFDDVADRIANRVKNELQISSTYNANKYGNQSYSPAPVTPTVNHSGSHDNFEEEEPTSRLNSHACPQCSQLMIDVHEPMLIIPCGHSVCRQCSEEDDLCPVCSCEITSVTCNIMLKQVINDFKREHRKVRSSRANSRSTSASASNYQDEIDYSEELKSLMMRLEILEGECDNIKDVMRVIQQDIQAEQQQIVHIEEQEDRVKKEMENLTKKLDALAKHKEKYRDNIEHLEDRHSKEADKLSMVRETIRELNRGVEKIQLRCSKV